MFAIVFAPEAAIEVTTITVWWRANRLLAPDLTASAIEVVRVRHAKRRPLARLKRR